MSRWFLRFLPLGGTSQRYLDRVSGLSISRRQFLRAQGICPEVRAWERWHQGLWSPRKRRCDAGQPRVLQWAAAQDVPLKNGQVAHLVPLRERGRFLVIVQHVAVAQVRKVCGTHRARWHCAACDFTCQERGTVLQHAFSLHFAAQCVANGVALAASPLVGAVPSHERRPRLPWRVQADS